MSILIVDDCVAAGRSLRSVLESRGYPDVAVVTSGEDALAALRARRQDKSAQSFDAVLMDLEMPGLDGVQTCRLIKQDPDLRDTSVLMVTGVPQEEALEVAFDAGACDYLPKPVQVVELLARLRSALSLKRELDNCKSRECELQAVTSQLQALNEELRRLAILDDLTGIANRRFFNLMLNQEWGRAARDVHPLSLIMIDIDYFKNFNDHYGHPQGDECLRRVASALNTFTNRPGDQVARYGGEEFVVLMPHTGLSGAGTVAERLRRRIEELGLEHASSPAAGRVTISLGVASTIPERRTSPDVLIAAADRAVYEAKHEGRNRVKVFSPGPGVSPLAPVEGKSQASA